ncbi:MAG: hypothetical protein ACRC62_22215 [Microcoleus sp.]
MLYLIGPAAYQLIKTAAGELLLKKVKPVPGQIDLFSGEVYQPKKKLQPKGQEEIAAQGRTDGIDFPQYFAAQGEAKD